MPQTRKLETVIIGAGHAGLTMSWYLAQAGRDHVILDRRSTLGGGWQDRWDAFRLVSPNWTTSFPGDPYTGDDPDEFMPRDAVAGRVRSYAEKIRAPVRLNTEVHRLMPRDGGFRLETSNGPMEATSVVVATGSFHAPRIPPISAELPARLHQLHSHAYRSDRSLPPGAVLMVGSGQSGVQIAEELRAAGREVYLSVGSAGHAPRRYRGRDFFYWLGMLLVYGDAVGVTLPNADTLPDPRMKLVANPQLSGHGGGHDMNLRQMAAEGLHLLGRIRRVNHERLELAADLSASLAKADAQFDERFRPLFDAFIDKAGVEAPPHQPSPIGLQPEEHLKLDLAKAGISTVIWTTGYALDYGWIDGLTFDDLGFPRQRRGVSEIPGLYFIGLLWQHTQASSTLRGPVLDARYLARDMGLPVPELEPPPPLYPPPALART